MGKTKKISDRNFLQVTAYRIIKLLFSVIFFFIIYSILFAFIFKWFDPPASAFMQLKSKKSLLGIVDFEPLNQNWISIKNISKNMQVAVIASEDQRFIEHSGFDIEQINKAIKEQQRGRMVRGASTITQQTAKNLFLWPGKDLFRKGMEAYYTILLELIWGKKRILEVYLNCAEFGDQIFGVEAAAKFFFRKAAYQLNKSESALLAAVLPNPIRYSAKNPSGFVIRRRDRIMHQIDLIGGDTYLKDL